MKDVFCLVLIVAFACLVVGCGQREEAQRGATLEKEKPVGAAETEKKPAETLEPVKKPTVVKFALRINCGSEADYTDPAKNMWKADKEFAKGGWGREGGDTVTREHTDRIGNTQLHKVYLTECYGADAYRITCPNGTYSVSLHFAETYFQDAGERVYDVMIEGKKVLAAFDPIKEAGKADAAVMKAFEVEVADGELTIQFAEDVRLPMINGIEVIQKK